MLNRKLDKILPKVQKPGRYVGGELNSVMKDKTAVDCRWGFCFPDTYEKRIRTPKDCLVWNNLALSNDNPLQEYGKLQIKK